MTLRAALLCLLTLAFALSPLLVPGFGGFEPGQFPVPQEDPPVQPAGYAFAIWGPIYLWLIVSAAWGLLRHREDPAWDAARLPLMVSVGVGAVWLPVALRSPLAATVLIWAMLAGALVALMRTPRAERWLLREPVGLYAGWLTAASAVSVGLVAAGWGVPPFGAVGWAVVSLSLGLAIALAVAWRAGSYAYPAAVAWALLAVLARNGADLVGLFALAAAAGVAAIAVLRLRRPATGA
jgi:hypothetical protein